MNFLKLFLGLEPYDEANKSVQQSISRGFYYPVLSLRFQNKEGTLFPY